METILQHWAVNWVTNHQQFLYGIAGGIILANPGKLAVLIFNLVVRLPGVGYWIATHPEAATDWADKFDKAIDDCVQKHAKKWAEQDSAEKERVKGLPPPPTIPPGPSI